MRHTLIFVTALAISQTSFAQIIEFDPPSAATPQLNAFAIVFNDGVSLEVAQRIAQSTDPVSFTVKFNDVVVTADTDRILTDDEATSLLADERVNSFRIEAGPRGLPATQGRLRVVILVQAQYTAYEARKIASKLSVLRIIDVRKTLNEIEVRLESENPETVAMLEELPQVKYVAYLAAE